MANLTNASSTPKTITSFFRIANANRTTAVTAVPRPSASKSPIIKLPFLFHSCRPQLVRAGSSGEIPRAKSGGFDRPARHHRRRRIIAVEGTQFLTALSSLQIIEQHVGAQNHE